MQSSNNCTLSRSPSGTRYRDVRAEHVKAAPLENWRDDASEGEDEEEATDEMGMQIEQLQPNGGN